MGRRATRRSPNLRAARESNEEVWLRAARDCAMRQRLSTAGDTTWSNRERFVFCLSTLCSSIGSLVLSKKLFFYTL